MDQFERLKVEILNLKAKTYLLRVEQVKKIGYVQIVEFIQSK